MNVHVVPVPWDSQQHRLRQIRELVFVEEQKVPREIEWDGEDDVCTHILALSESGEAVGCARLMPSGQIGRMAVLPAYRGTGLGRRLLDEAIEEAKRQGMQHVHLHAQTHAAGFYRKAGFLPVGGEFMEAGIPHQAMELELPIPFEPPAKVVTASIRPETSERAEAPPSRLRQHQGESDCAGGLREVVELPRRRLAILSQYLDHTLFDDDALIEALSRFARRGPGTEIRVLISDSSGIVGRGHRLVELARRLDSRITIRRIADATPPGEQSFVTWDGLGYFLMPDFREYQALSDAYDPVQARRLEEAFDYLWDRSVPDPELRTLNL